MNRHLRRRHVAAALGGAGGTLGLLAGAVQATVGGRMPEWTGDKDSALALGLLTVGLSGLALLAVRVLRVSDRLTPGRRLATATGLLVPGALCFSTAGRLWLLPGVLLLGAAALALAGGEAGATRRALAADWPRILVGALGTFVLMMAVGAGSSATVVVGVLGGLSLLAAPWVPGVRLRLVLLLLGAVPFAVLTWWTLVSPLVAVLALAVGVPALRRPVVTGDRATRVGSGSS